MVEDLKARLWRFAKWSLEDCDCGKCVQCRNTGAMAEAADHIESLEARVERLAEALQPFARIAVADDRLMGMDPGQMRHHVAQARTALEQLTKVEGEE
jgi:phosphoglycerate-specific signal transduction histidine kinase